MLIFCVVILSCVSLGFGEEAGTQEAAKQWEEIASLRYHAAIGHESRAVQKEALGTETPGEALDGAGDEKVSASERRPCHYQRGFVLRCIHKTGNEILNNFPFFCF